MVGYCRKAVIGGNGLPMPPPGFLTAWERRNFRCVRYHRHDQHSLLRRNDGYPLFAQRLHDRLSTGWDSRVTSSKLWTSIQKRSVALRVLLISLRDYAPPSLYRNMRFLGPSGLPIFIDVTALRETGCAAGWLRIPIRHSSCSALLVVRVNQIKQVA